METILLVEDEPLVRSIGATVLRAGGYTVLEATNGEEALRVADLESGKRIHLLLTDVEMPRIGGIELVKLFETLRPDTKVLVMSGHTDQRTEQYGERDEDAPFLQKPFLPAELLRKVREVLDEQD